MPLAEAHRHLSIHAPRALWLALALVGCGGGAGDCPVRYADIDGDGFGDHDRPVEDCEAPGVLDARDCDDSRDEVFPGAEEQCNDRDDDCNGLVDDLAVTGTPIYLDGDGDGFGTGRPWSGCGLPPPGYTAENDSDCDDGSPTRFPGATELCNDLDDNCNGSVDENAQDNLFFYLDQDGDGFGSNGSFAAACSIDDLPQPLDRYGYYGFAPGFVGDSGSYTTAVDSGTYIYGGDSGSGDIPSLPETVPPGRWVQEGGDCNDFDPGVSPIAPEICNGIDDDCDGPIDEDAQVLELGWLDRDGDGFGSDPYEVCGVGAVVADPDGSGLFVAVVATNGDCNDDDVSIHPNAPEVCNGIDDDCDGPIDDADDNRTTIGNLPWYLDTDDDGAGDPSTAVYTCLAPTPTATHDRTDCNDDDPDVFPGATEVCNQVDDDCDGFTDDFDPSVVGGPCP